MKKYENTKVLITGGTGFIGSRLTEKLTLEEKADVTVLVHDWRRATWVSRTNAKLVQGDITDPSDVDKAVKGNEVVFHCVGIGGTQSTCRRINVEGTKNVLNACKKYNVKRIVYLSTIGVHGPSIEEGLDEESVFRSLGYPYADSKIEAEKLFWQKTNENGIKGTVIRPTYVWGPNSMWFTIQPIQNLITDKFYLVDEGKGACNAVYVDNVIQLILITGWHPNAIGQAFLVTDGERLRWRDFFGYYAEIANVDISCIPSIKSSALLKEKFLFNLKTRITQGINRLTTIIDMSDNRRSYFVIFTLKALRRCLRIIYKSLDGFFPQPYNPWDIMKFSSPGFINITKAEKLLSFTPGISVQQGMKECAVWLKDQNYV